MGLIIRSSAIHAAGCYTTAPIKSGARVVEYTGPRISKEAADEKYQNSPTTYLFGLGDGEIVIDGHGTAMFINHSCDPNCETDEGQGPGLDQGITQYRRKRRTYVRLQPVRWRRDERGLQLWIGSLPQNHVLSRRNSPSQAR